MWRAIIFGCVLTIATATAGERSPGNDLNNDGGPKDRRHWRERHWRDRQEDWRPRYQPRYIIGLWLNLVAEAGGGVSSVMFKVTRKDTPCRRIALSGCRGQE
jgi:hypothetical protein